MYVIEGGRESLSDTVMEDIPHRNVGERRTHRQQPATRTIKAVEPTDREEAIAKGRKSFSGVGTSIAVEATAALLGVKVMAADMPDLMKVHAFRCARRSYDVLDKFSARQVAHDMKKEFDKVYGPTWHCIVGTSFGSFVTHSRGCFIYLSMGKIIIMLFKTGVRVKDS